MRWNCPHCNTALASADEKLDKGWNFSRCYKCGGFGLVRRAGVNLVKVDRVPDGEEIILSGKPDEIRATRDAIDARGCARAENTIEQQLKDHARAELEAAMDIQRHRKSAPAQAANPPRFVPPRPSLPDPAAESHSVNILTTPVRQTRDPASQVESAKTDLVEIKPAAIAAEVPFVFEDHLPPGRRTKQPSGILGVASIALLIGASYIYTREDSSLEERYEPGARTAKAGLLNEKDPVPARIEIDRPALAHAPPALDAVTQPNEGVSDQVEHSAMAPVRKVAQALANAGIPLKIQIRAKNALLREGPGTEFRSIGMVDTGETFVVSDWRERWFKITLPSSRPGDTAKQAWIRNDLVKIRSE